MQWANGRSHTDMMTAAVDMGHQAMCRRLSGHLLLVLCFIALAMWGCGGSGGSSEGDSAGISVRVVFPGQQASVRQEHILDFAPPPPHDQQITLTKLLEGLKGLYETRVAYAQVVPANVASLLLTITGEGIVTPIQANIDLGTGRVTVNVPIGNDRLFDVRAFPAGFLTPNFIGQTLVNVLPTGANVTVNMEPVNGNPPIANAGPDQSVIVGQTAQLDGSGSSDPNGDPLTFRWALNSRPSNSRATLSDPTLVNPTFVVDQPGPYVVQLIVNDGSFDSLPDTVTLTAVISGSGPQSPIVTNPGPQINLERDSVSLQIMAADPNGDLLSFSATNLPPGLSINPATGLIAGTLPFSAAGTYSVTVTASDGMLIGSIQFTWEVSIPPPIAMAGPDQTVFVGQTITLNGTGSSDPDGDPLMFRWSFLSIPTGSGATLSDPAAVQPTFVIDLPGAYIMQLVVNDRVANSAPDTVTITASLLSARFAFLGNVNDNTISVYLVDATTGQLQHHGYVAAVADISSETGPEGLTVDPLSRFLYAINGDGSIAGFAVDATMGSLTPIPGSPFSGLPFPQGQGRLAITTDPAGRFAYVTDASAAVFGFSVDATTGVLSPIPGSPFPTETAPSSVTVDPTGRFLYVANAGSNNVSGFMIDATTGALTSIPGSPFATRDSPSSLVVDPSARFAYIAVQNFILGYTINDTTGALTELPGSPFVNTDGATSVAVEPSGRFAYVLDLGFLSTYAIDATTGTLAQIPNSSVPAASGEPVVVDPSGRFLYVPDRGANTVLHFLIDTTTGIASTASPVRTRDMPVGMALSRGTAPVTITPRFAYVVNQFSNDVSGFTIDPTTGVLTPITGSPFPVGGEDPEEMAVDSSGQFAYVANFTSDTVSGFAIDPTTGVLAPIAGSPFPVGVAPSSVAVDPSGRFAYVANRGSDNISGFTINTITGTLIPIAGSPFPVGARPESVAVDPSGQFAYVVNSVSNDVSGFMIDPTSGVLTPMAGLPFPAGTDPRSLVVDPSGQFAYVANFLSGDVSGFTIDPSSGVLTPIAAFPVGTSTSWVAVDPSGQFAYVPNLEIQDLSVHGFMIDSTSGVLTPIAGSSFPTEFAALSVTVDPSGRFVYVSKADSTVSGFNLTAATGVLVPMPGAPLRVGIGPREIEVTATTQ